MSKRFPKPSGFGGKITQNTVPGGAGTIITDPDQINAVAAQKLSAIKQPETEPEKVTLGLTEDQVKLAIQTAVQASKDQLEAEIKNSVQEQIAALQAQLNEAKQSAEQLSAEKAEAEKKRADLEAVFNMLGQPTPVKESPKEETSAKNSVGCFFNVSTPYSNTPQGAARELYEHISKNTSYKVKDGDSGYSIAGHNYNQVEIRKFLAEKSTSGQTNKELVLNSMTHWGQGFGLFQGSGFNGRNINAVQVAAELRGGFLDTLSTVMREENRPGFTFWQFCPAKFNFAMGMGTTIQIPRTPNKPQATDPDDRKLSGTGTWRDIDPSAQSVQTGVVNAIVEEWGLGANPAAPPFGLPRFIQAFSMIDVYQAIMNLLYYDYISWEDLKIRKLWEQASTIIYNDGGLPTTTIGDLGSGDGTITKQFLLNLKVYLATQQVLALPDGSHILWLPAQGLAQFKDSLSDIERILDPQSARDLSNMLNPIMLAAGQGNERISGYHGNYYGFHIFSDNNYAVGAAGTAGVINRTAASATRAFRTGFVAGADSIGMGVAQDFSIVTDDYLFGRGDKFIWTKWAGYAALDVDPVGYNDTNPIPQQRRVFRLEMLDRAIA